MHTVLRISVYVGIYYSISQLNEETHITMLFFFIIFNGMLKSNQPHRQQCGMGKNEEAPSNLSWKLMCFTYIIGRPVLPSTRQQWNTIHFHDIL